jgi:hypothetical protein
MVDIFVISSKSVCLVVALKQQVWADYPKMCVCVYLCGVADTVTSSHSCLDPKSDVIILAPGRDERLS